MTKNNYPVEKVLAFNLGAKDWELGAQSWELGAKSWELGAKICELETRTRKDHIATRNQ